MKPLKNYVIVELKKSSSQPKQTKSGIYVLNQVVEDTTKNGDKVDTTSVVVVATGPDVNPDIKVGSKVFVNYYELQVMNEVEEGHVYGVIPDNEIKVIL